MDVRAYNRDAWDRSVLKGDRWTVPVTAAEIAAAREGRWEIILTPNKPVPRAWFPDLRELDVLALASGGGQQGPILAAAGANVTAFDNSPRQLAQDRLVAERDGLELVTVEGDMADLSVFPSESFDLIVHACSNCFVPDVRPVWREAYRVLRRGGALLSGFCDPIVFAIDPELEKQGIAQLKHRIPHSDVTSLSDEERRRYTDKGEPLAFGHTLEDQIGGQTDAGFLIAGFYGDLHVEGDVVSKYMPCFGATRAIKP
ncbi:MAG TPA: class I SAM-dependent methyltransferase [Polyangiaceae bacterium]